MRLSINVTDYSWSDGFDALHRVALGIDHAVVITSGPWTEEAIGVLAAAVPVLRDLGVP